MEYFNMDPSLIRRGGRKAPVGTVQHLIDVLDAGLPPAFDHSQEWGYSQYSVRAVDVLDERFGRVGNIIEMDGLGKVGSDLRRISPVVGFEFMKLGIAQNGIPYLFCRCEEEAGRPFAVLIYCDGKTLRGYLPRHGNMLDYPGFRPIFDLSYFSFPASKRPAFIQKDNGPVEERWFSDSEALFRYFEDSDDIVTYSEEACLMDFSSRVEPVGKMTEETVAAARKNVAKAYEKYVRQYPL